MHDFKPPKLNRAAVAVANGIIPFALRSRQVRAVHFDSDELARFRELRKERAVILPNHPTNTEPAIVFRLSQRVGEPFHYVCCREAFDKAGGLWGKFVQRLGGYSLVRGALDRPSFAMTRQLLGKPGTKLVIFPEGEVYSQNDSLLPFQSGVIQLAFWGLEDARKAEDGADVKLQPVAIRYRFVEDMKEAILASIARLEEAVGLPVDAKGDSYARVRRVGELVVSKLEKQFGIVPVEDAKLGDRMDVVKRTQLERAAEIAKVKLRGGLLAEEMRMVVNAVHKVTQDAAQPKTDYDRKLWEEARNHIRPALHELERLANWIAVYDGYVAADPSSERMVHLLVRMEQEVLGKVSIRGTQEAFVRIGTPLSLADHFADYQADKRQTVAGITMACETQVQEMLTSLASRA